MKAEKFNDGWVFWKESNAFSMTLQIPSNAEKVTLPHDAMIYEHPKKESFGGTSTGFRDAAFYCYSKRFYVGELNQKYVLKFEGIYRNAFVYVNGQLAGSRHYGYSVFYVNLNNYLLENADNYILVQVRAGAENGSRWYTGAGIYRDVYLLKSPNCFIRPDGVLIDTESVDGAGASLLVKTEICNEDNRVRKLILNSTIYDPNGVNETTVKSQISLFPEETRVVRQRIYIHTPFLWSEEEPALYKCKSELEIWGADERDVHMEFFGIRSMTLDPAFGLRVNGKVVKLRGACIHHDSGILGAATYEVSKFRQIKKLKDAGFNAIRVSHQPAAPILLHVCDVIGMYVMDESFDMWTRCKSDYDYSLYFNECWEEDMEAMVRKDYNHPCVIMYSVGNEIPEIGTLNGTKICSQLCEKIYSLDQSRFTLAAVNGVFACGDQVMEIANDIIKDSGTTKQAAHINDFMSIMKDHMSDIVRHRIVSECLERIDAQTDIVGYNYMEARYDDDVVKYPNRIMVGSETNPPVIADNWKKVRKFPALIGDFTWTGWDYIGEAGIGIAGYNPGEGGFASDFPVQLAYTGDFDITGIRRPISFYREIVFGFRQIPYIAVQNPDCCGKPVYGTPWFFTDAVSSWNWKGREGKKVNVEVYSSGEEVALFVNGHLVEKKTNGEEMEFRTCFETIYEPGELTAVSYTSGNEIGRYTLYTASGERKLILRPEIWGEHEIRFIDITMEDEQGHLYADAVDKITAEVKNGEILGFGNGDPRTSDYYPDNHATLFEGRALLIVRPFSGECEIAVSGEQGQYATTKCHAAV